MKIVGTGACLALILLLCTGVSNGEEATLIDVHIGWPTLLLIAVFLFVAFVFGKLAQLLGLREEVGELCGGLIIGPTVLLRIWPEAFQSISTDPVSRHSVGFAAFLGAFFLLLYSGLKLDLEEFMNRERMKKSFWIGFFGYPMRFVAVFSTAVIAASISPQGVEGYWWQTAAVVAGVMAMPALVSISRVTDEKQLTGTSLESYALGSGLVLELIGFFALTVIFGLGTGEQRPLSGSLIGIVIKALGIGAFAFVCRSVADRFLPKESDENGDERQAMLIVVIIAVMFGCGTAMLGFTALPGAFLAGLVASGLPDETRNKLTTSIRTIFMPIFFVALGFNIDLWKSFDLAWMGCVTLGTFGGAYLIHRALNGVVIMRSLYRHPLSILLSVGGPLQLALLEAARLSGRISETVLASCTVAVLVSMVTLYPWLNQALRHLVRLDIMKLIAVERITVQDREGTAPTVDELEEKFRVMTMRQFFDKVLTELCRFVASTGATSEFDEMTEAVRENIATARPCLGKGVFATYCRHGSVKEPALFIMRLAHPVEGEEFHREDKRPIWLVVLLLLPKSDNGAQITVFKSLGDIIDLTSFLKFAWDQSSPAEIADKLGRLADRVKLVSPDGANQGAVSTT